MTRLTKAERLAIARKEISMVETCEEKWTGGKVCGRLRPCSAHEHADQCEAYLRNVVRKAIRAMREVVEHDDHDPIENFLRTYSGLE